MLQIILIREKLVNEKPDKSHQSGEQIREGIHKQTEELKENYNFEIIIMKKKLN